MLSKIFNFLIKGFSIETLYYYAIYCRKKLGWRKYVYLYLEQKIQRKYSCYLSPKANIGTDLNIRHPVGVVIGEGVTIGNNVIIYQNVTLGAARVGEASKGLYPTIMDGVIIFSGAKIIGNINIGKNSIIGANSVVLNDVPSNCIAVGIPALIKPIRSYKNK